jgi:septum formation protein
MKKLILASTSPSRLKILNTIGIFPDEVMAPDIDESHEKNEHPSLLSARLALGKAMKIYETIDKSIFNDYLILSADTVSCKGRRILDKASNDEDVRSYLSLLSGGGSRIYSSFCIIDVSNGKISKKTCETRVKFRKLSKNDIDLYVSIGDGIGKAGGYAIEGYGEVFIEKISGSISNIRGFPSMKVDLALKSLGYNYRKLIQSS